MVNAISLLASNTSEGRVHLSALGQYLNSSPATYGHSGLVDMLKTYDLLALKRETGGHYTVGLQKPDLAKQRVNDDG
ncbi:OST-HTH/LOTUS domain-containing protein [Cupriavidus alkaliphilus]|uniref:OST-HTH/LOTUS domain-containing protein n=1 Tax=Cupriavidus alkaliphilus TaxID=942866 RepID=UPI00161AF159|nr:OST-HTH/LOTUS domain-containing protein [Cupriavidus alkaliphilus]MBB2915718.1 hypothetical protein [Cupriavidus alkaliphilus]